MLTNLELKNIKESIVNENELTLGEYGDVKKLPANIYQKINCYAYALGIMYPSIKYTPGFTTDSEYIEDLKESLIQKICEDLDNLGISYRRVEEDETLHENEYLIQVMYVPYYCDLWIKSDFHFSRKSKDGIWFSKPGWLHQTTSEYIEVVEKENDYEIVKIHTEKTTREYIRVGFFAITEKS